MKKEIGLACFAAVALSAVLGASPARRATVLPKAKSGRSEGAPVRFALPEARFAGEPISLDLKNVDLRDVLLTFGKLERINVAIDPEVHGSVTVQLHDVPWDQALDVILRSNGLGYVFEGNVLRVATPAKLADP